MEPLADIARANPLNLSRMFNDYAGMSVTDYVNRMCWDADGHRRARG